MKVFFYLIFFIEVFTHRCLAEIIFKDSLLKDPLELMVFHGIRISQKACGSECHAKKIIQKKIPFSDKTHLYKTINPTSYYCHSVEGKPGIFFLLDGSEVSICILKDQSFFLTWDLINPTKIE
jgi:hypothetical protein